MKFAPPDLVMTGVVVLERRVEGHIANVELARTVSSKLHSNPNRHAHRERQSVCMSRWRVIKASIALSDDKKSSSSIFGTTATLKGT